MNLINFLTILLVLYFVYKYLKQWYIKFFYVDNLPGYWPVPILGFNALRFWMHRDTLNRAQFEDTTAQGLFHHAWIFYDPFVAINKPGSFCCVTLETVHVIRTFTFF
jgi:hypothetical protein